MLYQSNALCLDSAVLKVVFDTNVLVAAARSRDGASFELVTAIPTPKYTVCLSVALYCEWQSVLTRAQNIPAGLGVNDVHGYLRFLATHAHLQEIHFLWRPFLADADDDMVLELAFASGAQYIVTHNVNDFRGSEQLGVSTITPRKFLNLVRTL
jgi:putative PIN family toxin of toxin-antitoxin system